MHKIFHLYIILSYFSFLICLSFFFSNLFICQKVDIHVKLNLSNIRKIFFKILSVFFKYFNFTE